MAGKYNVEELKKALSLAVAVGNAGTKLSDGMGLFGKIGLLLSMKDELMLMNGFDYKEALSEIEELDDSEILELSNLIRSKIDFSISKKKAENMVEDAFEGVMELVAALEKVISIFRPPQVEPSVGGK